MLAYTKFYNKENTDETFACASNEISLILVTRFLGNKWKIIPKKTFASPFLKHWLEWEKEKNYIGICKAFCVKRKRNNQDLF